MVLILVLALAAVAVGVMIWRRVAQPVGTSIEPVLRDELNRLREGIALDARLLREEVASAQREAIKELTQEVRSLAETNREALTAQGEKIQSHLLAAQKDGQALFERVRTAVETKLREIQTSNEQKLEAMRQTVDEKLQSTLEKRLGESFKLVSAQLDAVQQGLGEMRSLATGVGDLKRVLTNVRERGTWGEYQLRAILEQILTPDQFGCNVAVHGSERVEFAVKLPGRDEGGEPVWLPIDSKFPKEDYERLQQASQAGDQQAVQTAKDALLRRVADMAKTIHEKYVKPPKTTDFAILFLPTEGLYAEVLREPGFHDELQRNYRVLVAGPTTLSAILNSLRVGFQTLAIEKRAHEVWTVLGAVKTEFGKFGVVLEKVKGHLNKASETIDDATKRTKQMERKLRQVEQLPSAEAQRVLELPANGSAPADDEEER
ncbi:MAG: DNA recombination protein RmuC [Verrucomicrobiae bacterium]|nr:DNA recombination protein RmuC [Verrucomicrobiae bacterium]